MELHTSSAGVADPESNYFWASIGFGAFGCLLWALPLPRRQFFWVLLYMFLLHMLLGVTTFFARALFVVKASTGERKPLAQVDWIYADVAAQALVGLQVHAWSILGLRQDWWPTVPVGLLGAAFYPILSFWQPVVDTVFLWVLTISTLMALRRRETQPGGRRRRRLVFCLIPVCVSGSTLFTLFRHGPLDANTQRLGMSLLRFFQPWVTIPWFQFWIESRQEYFQPCWLSNARPAAAG